jgi:hypothetical protein
MAIGFTSLGTVTAADADPNVTPPLAARILKMPGPQGHNDFPSRVSLAAIFTAGTTPSLDGTVWVKDNLTTNRWFDFGTITTLNAVRQLISDVPPSAEVFFQVTALNGTPTDGTVLAHVH